MPATRSSLPSEKPALCGVTITLGKFHSGESSGSRLLREHVQVSAGKSAGAQRVNQRRFVDDIAARDVDHTAMSR